MATSKEKWVVERIGPFHCPVLIPKEERADRDDLLTLKEAQKLAREGNESTQNCVVVEIHEAVPFAD